MGGGSEELRRQANALRAEQRAAVHRGQRNALGVVCKPSLPHDAPGVSAGLAGLAQGALDVGRVKPARALLVLSGHFDMTDGALDGDTQSTNCQTPRG